MIPLYRETGDDAYLRAAELIVDNTRRWMDEFDVIPADYFDDLSRFSTFTLNETLFTSEGFAALYSVTGRSDLKASCAELMKSLIEKLYLGDGLFARFFIRAEGRNSGFEHDTKGQGWSMEGLLAAHETIPEDGRYLDLARRLAGIIMSAQHDDGHWTNFFDREDCTGGVGEKSTALWSLLLYRLYRHTHDGQYLQAARKALKWCMDNQYFGEDGHARGSLVATSAQSGIGYRKYFNISCTYASSFFGLAAMEEYKLRAAD